MRKFSVLLQLQSPDLAAAIRGLQPEFPFLEFLEASASSPSNPKLAVVEIPAGAHGDGFASFLSGLRSDRVLQNVPILILGDPASALPPGSHGPVEFLPAERAEGYLRFHARLWASAIAGALSGRGAAEREVKPVPPREAGNPDPSRLSGAAGNASASPAEEGSGEDRAQQSQKMEALGRLAGGVAHDFNNLLTAINGYGDLCLSLMPKDNPLRPHVEEIKRAGDQAALLTGQLLAFSRKQRVKPVQIDLNGRVTEMERMLRRLIGENIRFDLQLSTGLWPIFADPGQVEQVILNLALNARDAMPKGGNLRLTTANVEPGAAAETGQVLLTIADDGDGMEAETLAHLFEPFFTTKSHGKGTGLGLSTVYGIVAQAGGRIEVESRPGEGTVFKVYFPKREGEAQGKPSTRSFPVLARGDETVLLAEDEKAVRQLVKGILEAQGYKVLAAADGQEALELEAKLEGEVHLLLTDVVMPRMGGRELAQTLLGRRPRLRILYMSGYTDDSDVRGDIINASLPFLPKPFTPARLLTTVRETLDKKQI